MGLLVIKSPFLTRLRLGDPRKQLWSPSSFLRVNTVIAMASLAMMPAAARQGARLIYTCSSSSSSLLCTSLHCTILFYFRSRQEELLLSLHNFTFFLKKNSFGFRTEIVVFVVFASSSLRAQRGDTQELFFPVFNTEDLFVKQSSRCKREISPRHELSKGFRGHRHSKAEPNSVQGFPRQRQINRHSFL